MTQREHFPLRTEKRFKGKFFTGIIFRSVIYLIPTQNVEDSPQPEQISSLKMQIPSSPFAKIMPLYQPCPLPKLIGKFLQDLISFDKGCLSCCSVLHIVKQLLLSVYLLFSSHRKRWGL